MEYDVAIIGAGVIGAFCARSLSRYNLKIAILESSADVASGSSRANSGIVHAGFDAPTNSLKAKFNVQGNALMENVCEELGVKFGRLGSLVVAYSHEQTETLNELMGRGKVNGVKELSIIDREELVELEPNISDSAVGALFAKTAGIVCPYELNIAAVGNAMDNGCELFTNFEVIKIKLQGGVYSIGAKSGKIIKTKTVINCAGINSDNVAAIVGDNSFKIGARKGEYLLLDRAAVGLVRHTIFACPTNAGKGVLITPTVDGNVILGPTSREVIDRQDVTIEDCGVSEIIEKAKGMCKNIPFGSVITSFAGARAYSDAHDFIIGWSTKAQNFYNVAGIESPGLTSAPAIGEHVAGEVASKLHASTKSNFNPNRRSDFFFKFLDTSEQNELIKRRPEFGQIVCRCETVTLGEILDAVRRNPKPTTVDGIKLRTRAGMGRCQGGFCSPTVMEILMRELKLVETQITKNGGKSWIIKGATK